MTICPRTKFLGSCVSFMIRPLDAVSRTAQPGTELSVAAVLLARIIMARPYAHAAELLCPGGTHRLGVSSIGTYYTGDTITGISLGNTTLCPCLVWIARRLIISVGDLDPDPPVFGPPGSFPFLIKVLCGLL